MFLYQVKQERDKGINRDKDGFPSTRNSVSNSHARDNFFRKLPRNARLVVFSAPNNQESSIKRCSPLFSIGETNDSGLFSLREAFPPGRKQVGDAQRIGQPAQILGNMASQESDLDLGYPQSGIRGQESWSDGVMKGRIQVGSGALLFPTPQHSSTPKQLTPADSKPLKLDPHSERFL